MTILRPDLVLHSINDKWIARANPDRAAPDCGASDLCQKQHTNADGESSGANSDHPRSEQASNRRWCDYTVTLSSVGVMRGKRGEHIDPIGGPARTEVLTLGHIVVVVVVIIVVYGPRVIVVLLRLHEAAIIVIIVVVVVTTAPVVVVVVIVVDATIVVVIIIVVVVAAIAIVVVVVVVVVCAAEQASEHASVHGTMKTSIMTPRSVLGCCKMRIDKPRPAQTIPAHGNYPGPHPHSIQRRI